MNISEVATRYNLTPATLRYYEKQGLLPPITRNASGRRVYTTADLNWIEFIKCMRDSGLSIESLVKYTDLYQKGDYTLKERQDILLIEYEKLLEKQQQINTTVSKLEKKIKNYDKKIVQHQQQIVEKTDDRGVENHVSLSKN